MTDHLSVIELDSRFATEREARVRAATTARRTRAGYRRCTQSFVAGTALAAVAGGLVLYGLETDPEGTDQEIARFVAQEFARTGLLLFQGLGLALAASGAYLMSARKFAERWVRSRMTAEEGRLRCETLRLEIGYELGQDAFAAAGAAFRDFVEKQSRYLDESGGQHDRSAAMIAWLGALLAGLLAFGSAMGFVDNRTIVALFSLLGVCAPALAGVLQSWNEAIVGTGRVALHNTSWSHLNKLRGEMGIFDAAIAANDLPAALAFAKRVFEVLRADHAGFAQLQNRTLNVHESSRDRY